MDELETFVVVELLHVVVVGSFVGSHSVAVVGFAVAELHIDVVAVASVSFVGVNVAANQTAAGG